MDVKSDPPRDPVVLLQTKKAIICERAAKLHDVQLNRAIHKCIGDNGYNAVVTDGNGGASVNLDLLPEELINKLYNIVLRKLQEQALYVGPA